VTPQSQVMRNSSKTAFAFFVEDTLVEPLEDRTLDVEEGDDGMKLVLR
jgi:hypothetical protein